MILACVLVILLLASVLAFWADRLPECLKPVALPLPAAIAFGALAVAGIDWIKGADVVELTLPWVPYLNLNFVLRLGGVGLLMSLLITGIGALILLYASSYMHGDPLANRLYAFLYAFMFAMTGMVLADHLLLLFIFWELTSITSYLLIGFNSSRESARNNALQALLVTGLGGMALLAGFILLNLASGTWLLSELVAGAGRIQGHALYPAILILVLLGAFTKSAQFPFQFWLPNAMAAPTPVSAYLHSATMVKAGVYLLAVMLPVLGGTVAWQMTLCCVGGITLLTAGLSGLQQTDLKRILAATTLAVLGLLVLLLGIGTEKAVLAAMLFLFGHALYKATLFMVAGSVDHEAGTRDVRVLGGLARAMPWTAATALLAACSKMGLPPFFGFIGKEYVYKASTSWAFGGLITAVLIVGNALIFALAFKVAFLPFWRSARGELPKKPHEAPVAMLLGPILLSALGVVLGVWPALSEPLISTAQDAALGYGAHAHVELWHGISLPLALSAVTVGLGIALIFLSDKAALLLSGTRALSTERLYHAVFNSTLKFAFWQTRLLQSGLLRNYLLITILATASLVASKLWRFGGIELPGISGSVGVQVWIVSILMFIAVFAAILSSNRLTALISLGVVGYGVAFLFAQFSAPDLAVTQILVETLTVALFSWVVLRLPELSSKGTFKRRCLDAAVSVCCGLLITVLVLKSIAVDLAPSISETLAEWSLKEAQGANVVNVILVDFRALDTWGEITVLSIAAIGVWSLLYRGIRHQKEEEGS